MFHSASEFARVIFSQFALFSDILDWFKRSLSLSLSFFFITPKLISAAANKTVGLEKILSGINKFGNNLVKFMPRRCNRFISVSSTLTFVL